MSEPIRPKEIAKFKKDNIPDFVIDTFNSLIAKNFCNGEATVTRDEVEKGIALNNKEGLPFDYNWLNIEDLYEEYGWNVIYDKPAYYENYQAVFIFSVKD